MTKNNGSSLDFSNEKMKSIPDGIETKERKSYAITSLVTGLCALFSCIVVPILFFLTLPLGIIAIIFGAIVIARKQAGIGLAIAGLVTGIIALLITVLASILWLIVILIATGKIT